MAKDYYLPESDAGKDEFLTNFALKLPTYATALNLDATADVLPVTQAQGAFHWSLIVQEMFKTSAQQYTSFKNQLRDGPEGMPIDAPEVPVPGAAPTLPPAGIFKWLPKLINRIKNSPAYTEAIGEDLGIEGPEVTEAGVDAQPAIKVRLGDGGRPEVLWKKGEFDGLEIQVDRGVGWVFLAIDSLPDYVDTHPIPTTAATWKYRAIYRRGDGQVGQWSNVASIVVG
jgi:hypothetical protein